MSDIVDGYAVDAGGAPPTGSWSTPTRSGCCPAARTGSWPRLPEWSRTLSCRRAWQRAAARTVADPAAGSRDRRDRGIRSRRRAPVTVRVEPSIARVQRRRRRPVSPWWWTTATRTTGDRAADGQRPRARRRLPLRPGRGHRGSWRVGPREGWWPAPPVRNPVASSPGLAHRVRNRGRRRVDAAATWCSRRRWWSRTRWSSSCGARPWCGLRDGEVATARLRDSATGPGRRRGDRTARCQPTPSAWFARWTTTRGAGACRRFDRGRAPALLPAPEPGTEVTQPVALIASDGLRAARDPAHPRAQRQRVTDDDARRAARSQRRAPGEWRRGSSTVVVDNRGGRQPIRVRLRGDDPENVLAFAFNPAELTIGPGQARPAESWSRLGGPPPDRRSPARSRWLPPTAGSVSTTGSILQAVGDRRPWARVVLTRSAGC